jgi:excisionase family DNA binding protein
MLDIVQAAKYLGISESYLRHLVENGRIEANVPFSRRLMFKVNELDKLKYDLEYERAARKVLWHPDIVNRVCL